MKKPETRIYQRYNVTINGEGAGSSVLANSPWQAVESQIMGLQPATRKTVSVIIAVNEVTRESTVFQMVRKTGTVLVTLTR